MIKKITITISLVIALAGAGVLAHQNLTKSPCVTEGANVDSSVFCGKQFTFQYPNGWEVVETLNGRLVYLRNPNFPSLFSGVEDSRKAGLIMLVTFSAEHDREHNSKEQALEAAEDRVIESLSLFDRPEDHINKSSIGAGYPGFEATATRKGTLYGTYFVHKNRVNGLRIDDLTKLSDDQRQEAMAAYKDIRNTLKLRY